MPYTLNWVDECQVVIGVVVSSQCLHDVSTVKGQLVVLECRIRGTPPLQISWFRENEQIIDSADFRILRKSEWELDWLQHYFTCRLKEKLTPKLKCGRLRTMTSALYSKSSSHTIVLCEDQVWSLRSELKKKRCKNWCVGISDIYAFF